MTMHRDFSFLREFKVHGLHNLHEGDYVSRLKVPPAEVVEGNFMGIEFFWEITQAGAFVYALAAKWMLPWLLEAKNSPDPCILIRLP
jgi:hypothetical protein